MLSREKKKMRCDVPKKEPTTHQPLDAAPQVVLCAIFPEEGIMQEYDSSCKCIYK